MEKNPDSKLTFTYDEAFQKGREREAAQPLTTYAFIMLQDLAQKNPELKLVLGNDHHWKLSLHNETSFPEPVLDVLLPFDVEGEVHFRPLDETNWWSFVQSVQVAPDTAVTRMKERTPELEKVDFSKSPVKYPNTLKKLAEPLLMSCTQYGNFDLKLITFSQFLDLYYVQAEVASSDSEPAEPTNN